MSYDVRPWGGAPTAERPARPPRVVAVPVRTRRDVRRFVEFRYRLHRDDPNFVPPLRRDARRLLDRRRNPFFAYGDVGLFIAETRGRVAGRIAAVHNPRHNRVHRTRDGFFGQFECVDDPAVAAALFAAAARWLRHRGLQTMLGPVDFTMNDECGLLVDGFDSPPRVLMPYNPAYYPALLGRCGLEKATDLWTWECATAPLDPRLTRIAEHVRRRDGLTVRPADLRDFDAELARIKRVHDSAWRDNWGFVPMTDAEFTALARRLRRIADPGLIQLVEAGGEPVAVGLGLPDFNQALPAARGRLTTFGVPIGLARLALAARRVDRVRGVLCGVVAEYRRRGLEALLYARVWDAMAAGGYRGGIEMGWTLEDNRAINQSMQALGAVHAKTYRIYRRDL
ncbi:GNAT family N-acetyltransferase [Actinomadura vinacea]|uniref:GNAT family N-acetyltransferase n=1 Tax=Actinomadura vinacea TaxID=115336 RepID=A0ABN3K5R2_9ACTN